MTAFDELTWHEAMRQGHTALIESERLYEDINAAEGRSNLDIEKHLRRAEVKPPRPRSGSCEPASWEARASGPATQGPERGRDNAGMAPIRNPSASGCSISSPSRPSVATRPPGCVGTNIAIARMGGML
jgi:hypothetical protein